jgi:hypothetical protein
MSNKPWAVEIKRLLRHLYGAGIMFFYFFKWPVFLGLPFMYLQLGLHRNPILDMLWIVCAVLIAKDAYVLIKKRMKH